MGQYTYIYIYITLRDLGSHMARVPRSSLARPTPKEMVVCHAKVPEEMVVVQMTSAS